MTESELINKYCIRCENPDGCEFPMKCEIRERLDELEKEQNK